MYSKKLKIKFLQSLIKKLPYSISTVISSLNELTLIVPAQHIYNVVFFLKYHNMCQFKLISDLTAVDFVEKNKRFEVVYNFLSIKYNTRIRIKTHLNELNSVESIVKIHPCANWLEREVWDLYGIFFNNHPDLRRILTDYGFEGHPLRKNFPLNGFTSTRYNDVEKIVVVEPTELMQDFRSFDFESPWKNIE